MFESEARSPEAIDDDDEEEAIDADSHSGFEDSTPFEEEEEVC